MRSLHAIDSITSYHFYSDARSVLPFNQIPSLSAAPGWARLDGLTWTIMAIKAVCSLTTGVPGCVVRLGGDESAKRSLTTDGSGSSYSCVPSDGEHDA